MKKIGGKIKYDSLFKNFLYQAKLIKFKKLFFCEPILTPDYPN
jgi:hypothetical protein